LDNYPTTKGSYEYLLPGKIVKIDFNDHVAITSKTLTEVHHYTRTFETKNSYQACIVKLNIPFSGLGQLSGRARILLCLDDTVICDGSIYSHNDYTLVPLFLQGEFPNLKPGTHTIKLKCCVNEGTLYIPHYRKDLLEATIQPPIQATLIVVGIN
jgi:hypothetical protein